MHHILDENNTHQLRKEYMRSQSCWWFELVEKETGLVQIMTAKNKDSFDGVSCEKFKQWADNYGIGTVKMYKPMKG